MAGLLKQVWGKASNAYKGALAYRLKAAGVKYEDLLIETPEVNTALKRLDPEVLVSRERRIKRAFDASVKRKTMDPSTQTYGKQHASS